MRRYCFLSTISAFLLLVCLFLDSDSLVIVRPRSDNFQESETTKSSGPSFPFGRRHPRDGENLLVGDPLDRYFVRCKISFLGPCLPFKEEYVLSGEIAAARIYPDNRFPPGVLCELQNLVLAHNISSGSGSVDVARRNFVPGALSANTSQADGWHSRCQRTNRQSRP